MLPFGRMLQYGNTREQKKIKQFDTSYGSMYLLYSNGELYGRGRNGAYQIGNGTNTTVQDWFLMATDVAEFHIAYYTDSPCLIKKNDGSYWLSGRGYIFGSTTEIYSTVTDITAKLGDMVLGYDRLMFNEQNIWYVKDNRYYRMGLNSNRNLLDGTTTHITSFTEYVLAPGMKTLFPGTQGTICSYDDGTVRAIGNNNTALLGLPSLSPYTSLTVMTIPSITDVFFSQNCTWFRTVDGLYSCGSCQGGQLGNGVNDTNVRILNPIQLFDRNPTRIVNSEGLTILHRVTPIQYTGQSSRVGMGSTVMTVFTPNTVIPSLDFYVNNSASYYIQDGRLYGTGQVGFYNLLPGYTSTQSTYVELELPK